MGWLSGWSYRKSHVINSASGAGTNYQIRIIAHYGSGTDSGENVYLNEHCRSDFGDVRFTDDDGTTLLDYWIEERVDSDYAIFWVEVADDLSSNSATIYIYYGKSDATTTSSLSNTFVRIITDLKLALPFNEGTGSVVYDKSGNNLNGTIYNAAWITGKYGYALDFNGVSSYVEVPHSSLLEYLNYTLVCWIKADTLTAKWRGIVTKNREAGGDSNTIYGFWTSSTSNYLHFRSGTNVLNFFYSDTANFHMLATRVTSGGTSYCYRDKTQVGTLTDNRAQGSYPLQIGRANFAGTNEYFDGKIDEVRYFGKTLTESEIQDLYDYYPFEVPTNSESVGKTILRKYVSPEPSHGSWGNEEQPGGGQTYEIYVNAVSQSLATPTYETTYNISKEATVATYGLTSSEIIFNIPKDAVVNVLADMLVEVLRGVIEIFKEAVTAAQVLCQTETAFSISQNALAQALTQTLFELGIAKDAVVKASTTNAYEVTFTLPLDAIVKADALSTLESTFNISPEATLKVLAEIAIIKPTEVKITKLFLVIGDLAIQIQGN